MFRMSVLVLVWSVGCQYFSGCQAAPVEAATDPEAEIVILSPRAGDRFEIGATLPVKWKTQGKGIDEVNAVNIDLSPDSGKTWVGLLDKSIGLGDPKWGSFQWTIPADIQALGVHFDLADDSRIRIRIMQYSTSDANKIAVSQKSFSFVKK